VDARTVWRDHRKRSKDLRIDDALDLNVLRELIDPSIRRIIFYRRERRPTSGYLVSGDRRGVWQTRPRWLRANCSRPIDAKSIRYRMTSPKK
jgi:hypothetical protein